MSYVINVQNNQCVWWSQADGYLMDSHGYINSLVFLPAKGCLSLSLGSTGNSAATTGTFEIPLFDDFWKPSKAAWLLDSTADDGESLSAGLLSFSGRTLRILGSCQSGRGHEPNTSHILNGIIIQEQRLFARKHPKTNAKNCLVNNSPLSRNSKWNSTPSPNKTWQVWYINQKTCRSQFWQNWFLHKRHATKCLVAFLIDSP